MKLEDSVIIVTGGTSGIGLAAAKALQEKGAKVIITARNETDLQKLSEQYGFTAIRCDVSNEQEVLNLYKEVEEKFGPLDVLINNAAYGYFDLLENIDNKKFNDLFNVNVTGAMLMGREAAKVFIRQNRGNIINISSTSGLKGHIGGTAYSASKFALRGMTECWRAELRKYNVRVTLINPSEVQTNFSFNAGSDKKPFNPTKLVSEDIAHTIVSVLELDNHGFVTDLTVFATNPQ
jgi:3-oxoacyl-[acyl-carrier protein] reductase